MAADPTMDRATYWKVLMRRTLMLLGVWFVVGYGMGIFLAEPLNSFTLAGIPLGFWMAQQGSIFVFIGLIFMYALTTGRLDREAGVEEGGVEPPESAAPSPPGAH